MRRGADGGREVALVMGMEKRRELLAGSGLSVSGGPVEEKDLICSLTLLLKGISI